MGKGGARAGKPAKGTTREQKPKKSTKAKEEEKLGQQDIESAANYERLNQFADRQREKLKELQQQEMQYTNINKRILTTIHRRYMRQEKLEALRREIAILSQNHEREVDRKDALIQMLTRDLEDAEEQFEVARRTHLEKVELFVKLQEKKLAAVDSEFERDLKALKNEFLSEFEALQSQYARELREIRAIQAALEAEDAERLAAARNAHEAEREHIRNTNVESINGLRIDLENRIDDLEKQFDEAYNAYIEATGEKNKEFRQLQQYDRVHTEQIQKRKRKIERMVRELMIWRKKIELNKIECAERNAQLRRQREQVFQHCTALKAKMKRMRAAETKRLTDLALAARAAMQNNKQYLALAEQILQMAELVRKYETEREKVLPVDTTALAAAASMLKGKVSAEGVISSLNLGSSGQSGTPSPASAPFGATSLLPPGELSPEDSAHIANIAAVARDLMGGENEWGLLDVFYRKFNKVLLDKLAIQQEKRRLQKENGELRSILKQYLDGIAITEDVVESDNPLLIVNGRVNIVDKDRAATMRRPNVIVEGNQQARNYAVQQLK